MGKFMHGILWELRMGDAPSSFLFGTMHVKDARAFEWLPALVEKIKACQAFYAEIDLGPSGEITTCVPSIEKGNRLSDHLSRKKLIRLDRFCNKRYGFSLYAMDELYPIIVLQQLTLKHLNEEHQHILDMSLYNIANERGLQCDGIESLEEQLSIITSIPVNLQIKYLTDALEHHDAFVNQLKKLIEDYQGQQISSLYKRTRRSLGGMRKPMLYLRNERMAERIHELYRDNPESFFCIGAAHLAGQKGVLRKLKNAGFTLTNIPV